MNKIILDTSVVIALLASEQEQPFLLHILRGYQFLCAESILPEIGNAISAMFKRRRITLQQGLAMIAAFHQVEIQPISFNITRAIEISHAYRLYAYDAYVLECAERLHIPLVTLDARMKAVATELGMSLIEV